MKSRTKNLGLAGMVLGSSILSSCVPLAIGALYEHERLANAAHRQADAMERNGRRSPVQTYNPNETNGEVFTCTRYEDKDKNGEIEIRVDPRVSSEVWDKGKTDFIVGDQVFFAASVNNGIGRKLEYFSQAKPGDVPTKSIEGFVDMQRGVYWVGPVQLDIPGLWHSYWTLNGEKIGEHRIIVREKSSQSTTQR